MPIYEYECPSCHNRFDKRQSFSDPAAADCPQCGTAAKRRLQVPAILFKGGGWYATDNRRTDPEPSTSSGAKEEKASAAAAADAAAAPAASGSEP